MDPVIEFAYLLWSVLTIEFCLTHLTRIQSGYYFRWLNMIIADRLLP
jgi:hypothetical protein